MVSSNNGFLTGERFCNMDTGLTDSVDRLAHSAEIEQLLSRLDWRSEVEIKGCLPVDIGSAWVSNVKNAMVTPARIHP